MAAQPLRIGVTGADGFVGQNLLVRLSELEDMDVLTFVRGDDLDQLRAMVDASDIIIHLAGENRPKDPVNFETVNVELTRSLCAAMLRTCKSQSRRIPLILASSVQAERDNPYGNSKRAAEEIVRDYSARSASPASVFRLPGLFGKWCRPNYNSVVATFCHNIARGLPIEVNDPQASLPLVYIDDVISKFIATIKQQPKGFEFATVQPHYETTVGELAQYIRTFHDGRAQLRAETVGSGLVRALYATYLSYLPTDEFAYDVPAHTDERGVFVEILKTKNSGQFSYFTARPGVTRGGHYHHTKSEKFLVLKGAARFCFRHLQTDEIVQIETSGDYARIVETIPGWAHNVTNIGNDDLIVALWSNEVFDRDRPDTINSPVSS